MRASRAYITSLGTTSVLVASSLLMLVVFSTFVAFRAWPGDDVVNGLRDLIVDKNQSSLDLTGPAFLAAQAAPAAATVAASPPPGTPLLATGAGGPATSGPLGPPLGTTDSTPLGGTTLPQSNPQQNSSPSPAGGFVPTSPTTGLPPSAPDVRPLTGSLSERTRRLTGSLGDALGRVTPKLGKTVSQTGQRLSQLLDGLGTRLAPRSR
jgi:hypothetical protein